MIEKVHAFLQEYEDKQAANKIETFTVHFTAAGLLIKPQPAGTEEDAGIDLSPELHYSLHIFFSDIEGITYSSHDYITLKSLLNAHGTLERMTNNSDSIKNKL